MFTGLAVFFFTTLNDTWGQKSSIRNKVGIWYPKMWHCHSNFLGIFFSDQTAEVTETNGGQTYGNPFKLSLIQV